MSKVIQIAGASAMWGDSLFSIQQLLKHDGLNYIIYEALAEVTMAILTRAKMESEDMGYATHIIDPIFKKQFNPKFIKKALK